MLIRLLIFIISIISISSCSTTKFKGKSDKIKLLSEKKLGDSILSNELIFKWMKSRGTIALQMNQEEEEIDFNLRIKNDSLIWLNISKFKKKIGRAKIFKDSIILAIEYPEKLFYSGSIDEIAKKIGITLSYSFLENLFIGNSYIGSLNKFSYNIKENQYHIQSKIKKEKLVTFQSWINPNTFKSNRINISIPNSKFMFDMFFHEWSRMNGGIIPLRIRAVLKTISSEYTIELIHKNIKFDDPLKFPALNINENYQPIIIND
tara:strand:- start:44163 stop:44948 length:786 start_codon:yes stop_codon:yes gene_type:complete